MCRALGEPSVTVAATSQLARRLAIFDQHRQLDRQTGQGQPYISISNQQDSLIDRLDRSGIPRFLLFMDRITVHITTGPKRFSQLSIQVTLSIIMDQWTTYIGTCTLAACVNDILTCIHTSGISMLDGLYVVACLLACLMLSSCTLFSLLHAWIEWEVCLSACSRQAQCTDRIIHPAGSFWNRPDRAYAQYTHNTLITNKLLPLIITSSKWSEWRQCSGSHFQLPDIMGERPYTCTSISLPQNRIDRPITTLRLSIKG